MRPPPRKTPSSLPLSSLSQVSDMKAALKACGEDVNSVTEKPELVGPLTDSSNSHFTAIDNSSLHLLIR